PGRDRRSSRRLRGNGGMMTQSDTHPDISRYDTFPKPLAYTAAHWPHETAMSEKEFGIWLEYSWRDYQQAVESFALGMSALGLERGDVVGIIGDNRPEWVQCEVATHAVGAMSLGI